MRWIPYISAALFGICAIPLAFAPFAVAPNPPPQLIWGATLFTVPAGIFWGFVAGHYARIRELGHSPVSFAWLGAGTTLATGLSAGVAVSVYEAVRGSFGTDVLSSVLDFLPLALIFSIAAIPFGVVGGLVLDSVASKARRNAA
jgi:hypothetical protein